MLDHTETWGADEFRLACFNCKVDIHTDGHKIPYVTFDSDIDEGSSTPATLQSHIEQWWEEDWEHYLDRRQADAEATRDDAETHQIMEGGRP